MVVLSIGAHAARVSEQFVTLPQRDLESAELILALCILFLFAVALYSTFPEWRS